MVYVEIAVQSTYETMMIVDAYESRRQLSTVKVKGQR